MEKFDRIYQLHRLLHGRKTRVPLEDLKLRLECSEANVIRIIKAMRLHVGAPIERVSESDGCRYLPVAGGRAYQLPGLWLSGGGCADDRY